MTHGIVATESREVVPTACAEYSGRISYISASIVAEVALGIDVTAAAKSTQSLEKPISIIMTLIEIGITRSFIAHR